MIRKLPLQLNPDTGQRDQKLYGNIDANMYSTNHHQCQSCQSCQCIHALCGHLGGHRLHTARSRHSFSRDHHIIIIASCSPLRHYLPTSSTLFRLHAQMALLNEAAPPFRCAMSLLRALPTKLVVIPSEYNAKTPISMHGLLHDVLVIFDITVFSYLHNAICNLQYANHQTATSATAAFMNWYQQHPQHHRAQPLCYAAPLPRSLVVLQQPPPRPLHPWLAVSLRTCLGSS